MEQRLELRIARDAAERDEHVARADALADGARAVGHGAPGRSVQPLQAHGHAVGGRKLLLLLAARRGDRRLVRHGHQRLVGKGRQRLVRHGDQGLLRNRPGFGFGGCGSSRGPRPRCGDSGPGLRCRQPRLSGGGRRFQCLRLRHRRLHVQPRWFRHGRRRWLVRYAASHGHGQPHSRAAIHRCDPWRHAQRRDRRSIHEHQERQSSSATHDRRGCSCSSASRERVGLGCHCLPRSCQAGCNERIPLGHGW